MDLNFLVQRAQGVPLAHRQNAAKEALQECLLVTLMQGGLLEKTAFIGGTSLRILHRLPRFSEDLDFIALQGDPDIGRWAKSISRYLHKIGITPHLKPTPIHVDPQSGKRTQTLYLAVTSTAFAGFAREGLQVSFEFDLNPPQHLLPETRVLALANCQVSIPTLTLASLMAGKLHILLTRLDREKGRDWFDYLWYRRQGLLPNVPQLQSAIDQTTKFPPALYWMSHLRTRMTRVNWEAVRSDVRPFLENTEEAKELNEINLASLTPPPPFAVIKAELEQKALDDPLVGAAETDPIVQDIRRFALEGEIQAIELETVLEELRKRKSGTA